MSPCEIRSLLDYDRSQCTDSSCLNPSGTKGFGTHTKHQGGGGGGGNGPAQYLKNDKRYKPETLGDVRGIFQGLKKFQADITAVAW